MRKIVLEITLNDFRSFETQSISLEDVTCLIGANESGKTNLLDGVYLAYQGQRSGEEKKLMKQSDIRKNSRRHKAQELPRIAYTLSTDIVTNPVLVPLLQELSIDRIVLIREGNNFSVEFPERLLTATLIRNISPEPLVLRAGVISGTVEAKESKDKQRVKEKATADLLREMKLAPQQFFLLTPEQRGYVPSIESAIADRTAEKMEPSGVEEELQPLLLEDIKSNLRLFFWSYDREKYSLPDMITFDEIKINIDNRPVIGALFKLGGYQIQDIPKILEGQTETDYINFFEQLSETITTRIREKWRTNKELQIQITRQPDHLNINIKEPGYAIEPRFRSEGIRWFLAFIIGMAAEAAELKGFIILIDEPALFLHPGGQKDVLAEINRLAEDNQVIYSTHSHFMIDRRFSKRVRYLIKHVAEGYSITSVHEPTKEDIFKDPLLRSALVYAVSDISYLNELNILVEGSFDRRVLLLVTNWLLRHGDVEDVINVNTTAIISCDGASEIAKHARHCKANGLICLSLYDSDKSGTEAKKANSAQADSEKLEISGVVGQERVTMEDMLPQATYLKALEGWELRTSGNPAFPRMSEINKVLDKSLSEKGLSGSEYSEERKKLKQSLEDLLVKEFAEYLDEAVEDELAPLRKLVNTLSVRLAALHPS